MPEGRAVLFDFDGTLLDSMALHAEAYRRVLAPFGVRFADEEIYLREGARSESIIREQLRQRGHHPSADEVGRLAKDKQRIFLELGPPRLYPGAYDLVASVSERLAHVGLVTGTLRENLDRLAPELVPWFSHIVTTVDYTRDKPHPEPFAVAIRRMHVSPANVAVLENATRGIQSARAAGCGWVLGITTTMGHSALLEAGAHDVVGDHATALERLTTWTAAGETGPKPSNRRRPRSGPGPRTEH